VVAVSLDCCAESMQIEHAAADGSTSQQPPLCWMT
jgi:hypothetical protein